MYRYLFVLMVMFAFAACDDSSTSAGDSSGNGGAPAKQSKNFSCVVEDTENGVRQVLNFPKRFYWITEVTRYSEEQVLMDYNYTFYGADASDLLKSCGKMDEKKKYYVDGSYSCGKGRLTYRVLEDYREKDADYGVNTLEAFRIEALEDCEAKHEWFLDDVEDGFYER